MYMSSREERFTVLKDKLREILNIRAVLALLQWDEEVNMPPNGAEARGDQLKTIAQILHRLETDTYLGEELSYFYECKNGLSSDDAKMIEEARYDYQRAVKIPSSWVGKFAEVRSKAYHAWVQARHQSDFSIFQPYLDEIVSLCRERASLLGYEKSPYDALLEDFERGTDTQTLDRLFSELEQEQSKIYQSVLGEGRPGSVFEGKTWDTGKQWEITLQLLSAIGFDFNSGRQDRSVHPFTTNFDIYDVRITTRLNSTNLFSGIFSSLHEGGHALYEQGFRKEDRGTWLAQAPSLGIHESQSRFWENFVGRSFSFCQYFLPLLKQYFPNEFENIPPELLYREINRVFMNFIRVEADECSYNLHIVLRYRIEKDLIEGSIQVSDVPDYWNHLFEKLFGSAPPNDADGCLQDIHWSHGSFGYFPSYALGNLFAGQILEKIKTELNIDELIKEGDFIPVHDWLKKNIFEIGRRCCAKEIVEKISGKPVSSTLFLSYLKEKYSKIYQISL